MLVGGLYAAAMSQLYIRGKAIVPIEAETMEIVRVMRDGLPIE